MNNGKINIPVVILSKDETKILEQLKQEVRREVPCNKYRCEITTQTPSYNLNYIIDPTFSNINRLFLLSFKNID